MSKKYIISVIPGDGIGKEVIPIALKVLNKLSTLDKGTAEMFKNDRRY